MLHILESNILRFKKLTVGLKRLISNGVAHFLHFHSPLRVLLQVIMLSKNDSYQFWIFADMNNSLP
jgi:hypothetical protein